MKNPIRKAFAMFMVIYLIFLGTLLFMSWITGMPLIWTRAWVVPAIPGAIFAWLFYIIKGK